MKRNEVGVPHLDDWIIEKLNAGSNIGADSKLIPYNKVWEFYLFCPSLIN